MPTMCQCVKRSGTNCSLKSINRKAQLIAGPRGLVFRSAVTQGSSLSVFSSDQVLSAYPWFLSRGICKPQQRHMKWRSSFSSPYDSNNCQQCQLKCVSAHCFPTLTFSVFISRFSKLENALKINKETLHLKQQKKQAKPFKNKVCTELTVYTLKVMPSLNNNIII